MALRASRQGARPAVPASPPERCDRAQIEEARWVVTGPSGAFLTLCGHHYRQHEIALRVLGWTIQPILVKGV